MDMIDAEKFNECKRKDISRFKIENKEWLYTWGYADKYHKYTGLSNLIEWFEWGKEYYHYLPEEKVEKLAQKSYVSNKALFNQLGFDYKYYYRDQYNATDYIFQNFYPVPHRMQVNRILDFGAGYGRQANLWSQMNDS